MRDYSLDVTLGSELIRERSFYDVARLDETEYTGAFIEDEQSYMEFDLFLSEAYRLDLSRTEPASSPPIYWRSTLPMFPWYTDRPKPHIYQDFDRLDDPEEDGSDGKKDDPEKVENMPRVPMPVIVIPGPSPDPCFDPHSPECLQRQFKSAVVVDEGAYRMIIEQDEFTIEPKL